MRFLSRAKNALEWMQLAKFVADCLAAAASWKSVKKLLSYSPHISSDWASIIALLVAAGVLFGLIQWQERRPSRNFLAIDAPNGTFAVTSPQAGHLVEYKQTVYGTGPKGISLVEVWVQAGDNKYYRQGEARRLPNGQWMLRCTFGNEGRPGGKFKIYAREGTSKTPSPADELPAGSYTEPVPVYREF